MPAAEPSNTTQQSATPLAGEPSSPFPWDDPNGHPDHDDPGLDDVPADAPPDTQDGSQVVEPDTSRQRRMPIHARRRLIQFHRAQRAANARALHQHRTWAINTRRLIQFHRAQRPLL